MLVNLILGWYLLLLTFNLMVFIAVKTNDKSFPFKKIFLLNLIPGLNMIITLILFYQIFKQCGHKFIVNKEQHKYAVIIAVVMIVFITFMFTKSFIAGIMMTIIYGLMFYIMIKG